MDRDVRRRNGQHAGRVAARARAAGRRGSKSGRSRSWRLARDTDLDIVRVGLDRWEMETTLVEFARERRLRKFNEGYMRSERRIVVAAVMALLGRVAAPAVGGRRPPRPGVASAKPPGRPKAAPRRPRCRSAPGDVETDPIKCWWKTDRSTVIVGERFTVVLTCGIIETDADQGRARFQPARAVDHRPAAVRGDQGRPARGHQDAAVALHPVRVHGAAHRRRVVREGRRHSGASRSRTTSSRRSAADRTGRDQTYVAAGDADAGRSLVPKKAATSATRTPTTFAEIEAARVRSTASSWRRAIAFGFAVVLLGLALVRVVGRVPRADASAARPLPPARCSAAACASAARVQGRGRARRLDAGARRPRADGAPHRRRRRARPSGRAADRRPRTSRHATASSPCARAASAAAARSSRRRRRPGRSRDRSPRRNGTAPSRARGSDARRSSRSRCRPSALARYGRRRPARTARRSTRPSTSGIDALKRLRIAKRWPMRTVSALAQVRR